MLSFVTAGKYLRSAAISIFYLCILAGTLLNVSDTSKFVLKLSFLKYFLKLYNIFTKEESYQNSKITLNKLMNKKLNHKIKINE